MFEKMQNGQEVVSKSEPKIDAKKLKLDESIAKERERDLKEVKKGISNYPRAQKLLQENQSAFDKMYKLHWNRSNYEGEERRWGAINEMEKSLDAMEEEQKALQKMEQQHFN